MVACSRSEHGSIIVENLNKNGQMLVEVLCSMHRSLTFVKGLILYWEKEKEKGKKKNHRTEYLCMLVQGSCFLYISSINYYYS